MNKLMLTAALALVLGAGAASAATVGQDSTAQPQQFAQVSRQSTFVHTPFRIRPAVPLGSSASSVASFAGNANSGMPDVPGAPTATTVNGGGQ
jgi:hypothetical protein